MRDRQIQLRDAKDALQETQNKLEDSRNKFEESEKKLEESEKKLEDSKNESQGNQKKWQESQARFEYLQKRLKHSHKSLQDVRENLKDSEEQLRDSWKKVHESQEQLQGSQEHIEASREQLESYKRTVGDLKLLLFQTYAKAEQYNEAGEIYYEILDIHSEAIPPEKILEMKYSYAGQLHEQGDLEKVARAKKIAEDVWKTRKLHDSIFENPRMTSEKTKESHRQICSIYTSLQDFDAAEYEQRLVYQEVPKDDWVLENGDALAITLMKRKRYEEAALIRLDVWKERRQLANQELWDSCTVRSALLCISFLKEIVEDLSKTLTDHEKSEEDQDDVRHCMPWHERNILKMLQDVWRNAIGPKSRPEILEVGHELGSRLIAGGKYADAESILNHVWEASTALYPEANQLTMSTGKSLIDAIKLQESPGRNERAAIYRRILDKAKPIFGEDDDWVISVGTTLAETLFLDENYAGPDGAEGICRWVLEQKEKKLGQADPQLDDARYKLGKAVHAQGRERYDGLPRILQDVYDRWNNSLTKPSATVECGRMLVQAYEGYEGLAALDRIRTLFDGRDPVSEKDILYLESGHLLGKSLLKQGKSKEAREILHRVWHYQAELPEEIRIRLRCGRLYGQSLLRCNQYSSAKKILESVELAQRAQPDIFGEGSTEGEQVGRLLRQVCRRR